jgi:hypothetical protein
MLSSADFLHRQTLKSALWLTVESAVSDRAYHQPFGSHSLQISDPRQKNSVVNSSIIIIRSSIFEDFSFRRSALPQE